MVVGVKLQITDFHHSGAYVVKQLVCEAGFSKEVALQRSSLWTPKQPQLVSTSEGGLDSSIVVVQGISPC